jgi:deoxycytidylate deaminase
MLVDLNVCKCAKQTTIAIIYNKGNYYLGTNWCHEPQKKCPRGNMPSGVGYDLCNDICKQPAHAEVNAVRNAGKNAKGGVLYLIGHTYVCDDCMKVLKKAGIKQTIICGDMWSKKGK